MVSDMSQYKVPLETMPWVTAAPGVRFKLYRQGDRQIRLAEFTGEFVEPDWCKKGHIGYVLEGRLELDVNGQAVVFHPGDGIFIPAGEPHKHIAKTLTDVVKIILVEDA